MPLKCALIYLKLSITPQSNKNPKKPQNELESKYYEEVSKYLGSRIENFRHIDKNYNATKVDLVSGIIFTSEGTPIYLSDMGTGQSQSAYLLGLLNVKDDKRKIIALFDEIAMMDKISLEPIIFKMKQLYDDEKLLFGIIVQRSDDIKVTSLLGDNV